MKIIEYLNSKSGIFLEIMAYIFVFLIGYVDYITGEEIAFSIFYLIPISIVAWYGSVLRGVIISVFCAFIWLEADLLALHLYSHSAIPYWNALVRLGFFIIITFLLSSKRSSEEKSARLRSEKEAMKDEFLATIAHDLKNPITSILGYIYILSIADSGKVSSERIREGTKIMKMSCNIMLDLIDNMIDSYRAEAGQLQLNFEDFSLNDLINEIRTTYDPEAQIHDISLRFSIPEGLSVRADRRMIRRVFYNLISNAFRYTPEKGSITISVVSGNERVEIEVKDTGSGISEADREKVFQKFSQEKGKRRGSSGLGLYLVKTLLKEHGSDIRLESEVNKGTSLFFSLPVGKETQSK